MSFLVLSTLVVVLAGLHVSESSGDYVKVESFGVGMSATAIYTGPGDGKSVVQLMDTDKGVVLTMSHRYNPNGDILVLNTRPAGGEWGTEQHVNDFNTTPGANVNLTAKAEDGHFAIIANGLQVATYDYRLPVESVKRLLFFTSEGSGSELVSLTFGF